MLELVKNQVFKDFPMVDKLTGLVKTDNLASKKHLKMQDMKKSTVCLNLYEWIKVMDEIYIRTDMNNQIATGHMMRCLAIADALQKNRIKVNFIVADESALELLKNMDIKLLYYIQNGIIKKQNCQF